ELMARAELARFATGRLGVVHGHSIDRREVAQLFAAGTRPIATEARTYFGSFDHIYSFFAADDERFRGPLDAASGARASYFPFRPPGAGHVAECYLRLIEPDAREMPSNAFDCSFELNREDLDLAEDRLAGLGLEVGQ